MDASRPVLIVENLSKSYGNLRALDDVSLTVNPGELVALLGPNGAGKSTLLQLLTGLFSPDQGRVLVLGHDLSRSPTKALAGIGVVFQQATLDLELSVRANLLFHADLHGLSHRVARQRIRAALERFGLSDRARDRARTLSGGNRRRLELARALLHHPRVLLMDEATVGLDPASRRDIMNDMSRLKRDAGVGILWTTHLVDEAERADRIAVLHMGKIVFDGAPTKLLEEANAETISDAFFNMTGSRGNDGDAALSGARQSGHAGQSGGFGGRRTGGSS